MDGSCYTSPTMGDEVLLGAQQEDEKVYRRTLWWVEHRAFLKRMLFVLFAAVDGVVVAYAAWGLLNSFVLEREAETQAFHSMMLGQDDLHAYTQATKAEALDAGSVTVLSGVTGVYDLAVVLKNPNTDWWAEYTYKFTWSNGETEELSGFVLPASETYAAAFAVKSESAPRDASFVLSDVAWHRVDHHVTGDYLTWIGEHTRFEITNAAFAPLEVEGKEPIGRATFTVNNRTPYSYYDVGFYVALKRGSTLVGLTHTAISSMDARTMQDVDVNWFGTLPSPNKVEVSVELNPFDEGVYKPYESTPTDDSRTRVTPKRR